MIPMRAPLGVLSLAVAGQTIPVVNGIAQIPPPHVRHALAHKFELLDTKNVDDIVRGDIEEALKKAQAAYTVSAFQAREGMKSLSIEGVNYAVGEDGYVTVPSNHAGIAQLLGCTPTEMRKVDDPDAPSPFTEENAPRDEAGLRLDGPTLPQYVAAGYKAEGYPPQGYADKRTDEERAAAEAALAAQQQGSQGSQNGGSSGSGSQGQDGGQGGGDSGQGQGGATGGGSQDQQPKPLPPLKEVMAMDEPTLRAWLLTFGVELLGDATRKQLNTAAKETYERAVAAQKLAAEEEAKG